MQDFKHKLAVITGGASGVGRSLAFALGREGGRVLIADVDQAALTQTQADLSAAGIDAHSSFCDVSSADSVKALAIKAFDEFVKFIQSIWNIVIFCSKIKCNIFSIQTVWLGLKC